MIQINFNNGWSVQTGVEDGFAKVMGKVEDTTPVTLPHDAMIWEKRDPQCKSGVQSGFYPGKTYTYTKTFEVPENWENKQHYLEFEGVMSKAMVYVNNEFAGKHKYGYSQFYVNITPFIKYGKSNTIKVIAVNQDMSCRWYSGSGIYRDVKLMTGDPIHILPEGVRLTTEYVEEDYAVIRAEVKIRSVGERFKKVRIVNSLYDQEGNLSAQGENVVTVGGDDKAGFQSSHMRITLLSPRLWSPDTPALYQCITKIFEGEECLDTTQESFGIRTLKLDAKKGLRINGQEIKLRGCCIHHDNGIIGAATLYQAEEFRVRNLKEAGFNSIRSAHHPMSKAMLRACDRLGILVMDELTDVWNDLKNCNDIGLDFAEVWKQEAERMVSKDYNHPSVIFYSLGNEIPEIGRTCGSRTNRELSNFIRELDPSRYITNAFSGILATADCMEEFSAADMGFNEAETTQSNKDISSESSGSEGLNSIMGDMQKQMLYSFSRSSLLGERLEEASCELDVVGYNYLTGRHELEKELHPDRVVVGSETYPPEIAELWDIVERNPHVIGDYSWTGYDYLGEAGIGIYHYQADNQQQGWYPDRLAYCGDININAYRRSISYLREIAYGLRSNPFIAVERIEHYGKTYDKNYWKYIDAIDSWTYDGYEGHPVRVHVLSGAEEVELILNGKSQGKKKVGETDRLTAVFELIYEPGILEAISYKQGTESGRIAIRTAGKVSDFRVAVVNEELIADGQSVAFLMVDLVDENGNINHWGEKEVTVSVEGAGSLLGFGSADPQAEGSYQDTTWKTFDGRVMAVVRSGMESGEIIVTFSAQGCRESKVKLNVIPETCPTCTDYGIDAVSYQ